MAFARGCCRDTNGSFATSYWLGARQLAAGAPVCGCRQAYEQFVRKLDDEGNRVAHATQSAPAAQIRQKALESSCPLLGACSRQIAKADIGAPHEAVWSGRVHFPSASRPVGAAWPQASLIQFARLDRAALDFLLLPVGAAGPNRRRRKSSARRCKFVYILHGTVATFRITWTSSEFRRRKLR